MSSTATPLGFNKQGDGDNANTWGDVLNAQVFDLIDEAIRGVYAFSLSGAVTLDATNYVSNQARRAILNVTGGTGGTVTVPDISKLYVVVNGASGDVTIKGSGTGCAVKAGEVCQVVNDGSVCKRVTPFYFGGASLSGITQITVTNGPTADLNLATKKYVDDTAFATQSGSYPGQTGKAGAFLKTDGTNPGWAFPATTDLSDLATYNASWKRRRLFQNGSLMG